MKLIIVIIGVFLLLTIQAFAQYSDCNDVPQEVKDQGGITRTCDDTLTSCGTLSNANTYYLLGNDVTTDTTCFTIDAQNVVLDLNEYTVTYDNEAPLIVPEGDFESGLVNWDTTNSPSASITTSFPVSVEDWINEELETRVLTLTAPDEYVLSSPIIVVPGKEYILALQVNDEEFLGGQFYAEIEGVNTCTDYSGNPVGVSVSGGSQTGWYAASCRFTPTTNQAQVKLGTTSNLANPVYFDAIEVKPVGHYGIYFEGFADAGANSRVTNGNIVQGRGGGYYSSGVVSGSTYSEIDNLNISTYGPVSHAVYGRNLYSHVHHNTVRCYAKRNFETHFTDSPAIAFDLGRDLGGPPAYADGAIIHHNVVLDAPAGIYPPDHSETYSNNVSFTARSIHSYGIGGGRVDNFKIYDNIINTNHGTYSGSGMFFDGGKHAEIYNNYINVRESGIHEERGFWITKGIWARGTSGNLSFYNNTIIVHAGIGLVVPGQNSSAEGIQIGGYDDVLGPMRFFDNYVEVDTNLESDDSWALALGLNTDAPHGGHEIFSDSQNNLYVIDDAQNIYKSIDSGYNWELMINDFDGYSYDNERVISGVVTSSDEFIFLNERGEVWYSDDGFSWSMRNSNCGSRGYYADMTIDTNGVLYILTGGWGDNSVLRSTDQGFSWETMASDLNGADETRIYAIVADHNNYLYAFGQNANSYLDYAWKSENSGVDWNLISTNYNSEVEGNEGWDYPVAALVNNTNAIWVLDADARVWASTDEGITWDQLSGDRIFPAGNYYTDFIVDSNDNAFGIYNRAIYGSFDSGNTWNQLAGGFNTLDGGITKYIHNNTFKSNDWLIGLGGVPVYSYGYGLKSHIFSNTFIKSENPTSALTTFYSGNSVKNELLDNIFLGGADAHDIGYSSGGYRDLNISWYLDVRVEDTGGALLPGAEIIINDTNDITRDFATTDGTVYRSKLVEQHIGGEGHIPPDLIITDYSPYTVTATYGGKTQSKPVTLNHSQEVIFIFSTSNCTLPYDYEPCDCIDNDELAVTINAWYNDLIKINPLIVNIKSWKACS